MTKSRAYLLAAVTFGMGFVVAIFVGPFIPGPNSYYRRMNESLEKENRLLKELNMVQEEQLGKINAVLKKGEGAKD